MNEIDLLVEPLLQELEDGLEGTTVTAIGGGHGLAAALEAILDYADVVNAVVTVADDGGSSVCADGRTGRPHRPARPRCLSGPGQRDAGHRPFCISL